MAQEGRAQRCSNSSSGGGGGSGPAVGGVGGSYSSRSSKKLKHNKVPQRGMGVAQLERILSEEQQKLDVAAASASSVLVSTNSIISPSNSSSCLAIQNHNFRPAVSSNSIPLPPPMPTNIPVIPNIDVMNPNSTPLSKSMTVGGDETVWPGIPGPGRGNWPKLWNGEFHLEGKNHGLDHSGFAFPVNISLPYESDTPIWPLPNIMQRSQQFQQPCSSSMVNVSVGNSSASVMSFQIEPPSNQSYCSKNYTHLWPDEEKMVGMKRSYPFSLENVPIPSFHCKLPSTYVSPITRSDESASCSNGGTTSIEPANPVFRDGPSSSSAISEPKPKKVTKENGGLAGDFLSLAPPQSAQMHLSSKQKQQSSPYLSLHSQELPHFEALPRQGCTRDPIHFPGRDGSNQQLFLSFFPPAKTHMGQSVTSTDNGVGEAGESVDLNLKL